MNSRRLRILHLTLSAATGLALLAPESGPAWAQSGSTNAECRSNPHLARARELYDELQFDEAAATLQRAIEYANNCRYDLAEIYRLKAFVDAVNQERERCHRDFEIFLALSPDYVMPDDVPPKIRSCYEDAKSVAPSRRTLGINHAPPEDSQPNTPVSMRVEVTDPLRLVDQVRVYFRREGVKIFTVVSARADDTVSVVIPALALPPSEAGYQMEYIVRAVDRWGGVLAEQGSPKSPLTFNVVAGGLGAGVAGEPWFWVALGAGVIGVAVGVFFLAQGDDGTIPVTFFEQQPMGLSHGP